MLSPRTHRRVNLFGRLISSILGATSLSFFIIILFKVFDVNFWPENPGMSVLAVGSLSFAILWNIIAIVILLINNLSKYVHIIGDTISILVLVVVGSIGFAHDDSHYLSNGEYLNSDNGNWLVCALAGGILALVMICVQIILLVLGLLNPKQAKPMSETYIDEPPVYVADKVGDKEKDLETAWDSVSEFEVTKPSPAADKEKLAL